MRVVFASSTRCGFGVLRSQRIIEGDVAELTPKQAAFVEEYLVDLNATQAARRAGYSSHSAPRYGVALLNRAHIRAEVQRRMNERAAAVEVTQERVVLELARLAFSNNLSFIKVNRETGEATVDLSDIGPDEAAAIQEITSDVYQDGTGEVKSTKLKLHPKTQALQLLGKHLGMFTDRFEIDVNHRMVPLDRLSPELKRAIAVELKQLEDAGEIRPMKLIEGGKR